MPEQTEVSFAAFFNAFPASYWRRWSTLRTLHRRLDVEGEGRIDVYRSKATAPRSSCTVNWRRPQPGVPQFVGIFWLDRKHRAW
ncbi:MAG: hypothetical protein M3460_20935 [Actinomycetota bacterium]|nr:hypothetical protein [Actinomycetota bacterium]